MIFLEKRQLDKIEGMIRDYSGIILERVTSKDISSKIHEHMQRLNLVKFDDYLTVLDSGLDDKPVLADLISELTISESFFFRNPGQFRFLIEKQLPEIFSARGKKHPIRIWSAGCARGEEAYSIAMVARKFQILNPGCEFHIYAGDINRKNLSFAKDGIYNSRALRNRVETFENLLGLPLGKRDKEGFCRVSDEIKNLVQFRVLNLKQIPSLKCMAGSDIIFCRNVLIYFSEEFRRILVEEFARFLVPGGLLCLGESECLPKDVTGFEIINHENSYCYRKPSF
ncbi:MAG: chemotaxis protein methyltransferase CheR [Clostridiales bacterium]|nr:chemotaxis protein methyltransferase CheR [Clostridiales bacterium]MDN5282497.1 chemotaxis protein methyltransferase CheR [Candidatus Ozemobacter sp.]